MNKTPEQMLEEDDCDWPDLVRYCERTGEIPTCFKDFEPTLHFCQEWDQAVVCDKMSEFDSCKCFK